VFELILVVQLSIVGVLVHPDAVADPTLAQATQAICVTMTFLPTMAVLDFSPGTPGEGLFGKRAVPPLPKFHQARLSRTSTLGGQALAKTLAWHT